MRGLFILFWGLASIFVNAQSFEGVVKLSVEYRGGFAADMMKKYDERKKYKCDFGLRLPEI